MALCQQQPVIPWCLTHWVEASQTSFCAQSRMNTGAGSIIRSLLPTSKRKCGVMGSELNPVARASAQRRSRILSNPIPEECKSPLNPPPR
jgi:hypothetical protein